MPALSDGLYDHLSSRLSVGDRVYPLTLPQGAVLPAVVYQLVGGEGPLHSHGDAQGGEGPARPTFQRSRVQLGCWADSARAAEVLGMEVQSALDGFSLCAQQLVPGAPGRTRAADSHSS